MSVTHLPKDCLCTYLLRSRAKSSSVSRIPERQERCELCNDVVGAIEICAERLCRWFSLQPNEKSGVRICLKRDNMCIGWCFMTKQAASVTPSSMVEPGIRRCTQVSACLVWYVKCRRREVNLTKRVEEKSSFCQLKWRKAKMPYIAWQFVVCDVDCQHSCTHKFNSRSRELRKNLEQGQSFPLRFRMKTCTRVCDELGKGYVQFMCSCWCFPTKHLPRHGFN